MKENKVTYSIRGAAFEVHNASGPGLLESIYERAIEYELAKRAHCTQSQLDISVVYDKVTLDIGFRLDLLVSDLVIKELKSVETALQVHDKQLLTNLHRTDKRLGLLINFNAANLKDSISRIIN